MPTSANFAKQKVTLDPQYIAEAGYYFTYLSYEGQSNNYVYFDDYQVRHVKSNLIQGNEYYPFGMQTANSWTREAVTGNNYLANGGTELNQTSQLYDLHYRNYDPALGRMFQIDPMASKYGSLTPYNYSLNNPANLNDPLGDDVEPQPAYPREYLCAMCWRSGDSRSLYMFVNGGGGPESGWSYRQSGINSANTFWHRDIVEMKEDAFTAHSTGNYADFGAKYGATIYEKGAGTESSAEIFNPWMGAEISRTADNTITYSGGWMKLDFGIMAKLMIKGYQINVRNVGSVNRFYADGGQQTQGGSLSVSQAGFGDDMLGLWSAASFGRMAFDETRSYGLVRSTKAMYDEYKSIRSFNSAYKVGRQAQLLSNISSNKSAYEVIKAGSKRMAFVGLAVGAVDMANKGFTTESMVLFGADAVMSYVAFMGPVGAGAAVIYFTGRFAYDLYQASQDGK